MQWVRPKGLRNSERIHTFDATEIQALYLACETLMERIIMITPLLAWLK